MIGMSLVLGTSGTRASIVKLMRHANLNDRPCTRPAICKIPKVSSVRCRSLLELLSSQVSLHNGAQFRTRQLLMLRRGDRHGPPLLRRLSNFFSPRLTAWQSVVITLLWLYVARNFGKLVNLECPEPLANLYSPAYFRATWITTALDAGFWTAMHVRPKWARDIISLVCSVYYLVCAEQADEKVRKVRGALTVDHLRVSWNKPTTPYLSALTKLLRPRLMRFPPRALRIPRPKASSYREPIHAWLYFDGPLSALKRYNKIVMDIPGGGFVAMTPRDHEDKLLAWAGRTGLPVIALDYRKAPEHPYPYALNECYDAYHSIVSSRGRCMGLSGDVRPQIVVSGDSAGGNLAVGMTLMILQARSADTRRFSSERRLPPPDGLVLVYPALDVNITSWMTDDQMALIRDKRVRKTNESVLRRKSDDYRKLAKTPHGSDDDVQSDGEAVDLRLRRKGRAAHRDDGPHESPTAVRLGQSQTQQADDALTHEIDAALSKQAQPKPDTSTQTAAVQAGKPQLLRTRLAMTSMISYFGDRILSPEMLRAMVILYIGPHNRPDLSTDFLLSPLLAPESLLTDFPKTYIMTGERDPLVDDTVIFAGRLRQAKYASWVERREMGLLSRREEKLGFQEHDVVEVMLVPGISHGFLQFVSIFPEAWGYIHRCSRWMQELFAHADETLQREEEAAAERDTSESSAARTPAVSARLLREHVAAQRKKDQRHHRRANTASSADEDRPLEMSIVRPLTKGKGRRSPGSNAAPSQAAAVDARDEMGDDRDIRGQRRSLQGDGKVDKDGRVLSLQKTNSLVRLASSDDLLSRRMMALTEGLTGTLAGEEAGPSSH